jgi:hypothetical protein
MTEEGFKKYPNCPPGLKSAWKEVHHWVKPSRDSKKLSIKKPQLELLFPDTEASVRAALLTKNLQAAVVKAKALLAAPEAKSTRARLTWTQIVTMTWRS